MSRLDRLVQILDHGSTTFIRNTAADQLADLAKQHSADLLPLLSRVYPFLLHPRWETRVAAARAFGGIVKHAPQWIPDGDATVKLEDEDPILNDMAHLSLLRFSDWSLDDIIQSGHILLANSGEQYVLFKSNPNTKESNASKRQKTAFTGKLGLDDPMNEKSIVKEQQTTIKQENEISQLPVHPTSSSSISGSGSSAATPKMSARMRALAKRKAKNDRNTKTSTPVDLSQSSVSHSLSKSENTTANIKKEEFDITSQSNGSIVMETKKSIDDSILAEHAKYQDLVWIFQGVYELLVKNLFDPSWEVRHGATLGLREIIKYQAKCAGRVATKTNEENEIRNQKTLEDLTVRILSVFSMDRFGDYVSDTVVAPVRENAAQVLATLLIHLDDASILKTFSALCELIEQPQHTAIQIKTEAINQLIGRKPADRAQTIWEAKHGGLLGLRYFVSIKTELLMSNIDILNRTSQIVLSCLCTQGDDDVQTVAAATLVPITSAVVKQSSNNVITELVKILWTVLGEGRDDLSAATGAIMDLLAKLCQHKEVLDVMKQMSTENSNVNKSDVSNNDADYESKDSHVNDWNFTKLVKRLYPFLRHSITSVRKAVLRTLLAFLEINDKSMKKWAVDSNGLLIRLIFQNILFEQNVEVKDLSVELFKKLIDEAQITGIENVFAHHFLPLLDLLSTPVGLPRFGYSMNPSNIMRPFGSTMKSSDLSLTGINSKNFQSDSSVSFYIEHNGESSKNNKDGSPFEDDQTKKKRKRKASVMAVQTTNGIPESEYDLFVNIDAPMINGDSTLVGSETIWQTRILAAKALGFTLSKYSDLFLLSEHIKQLNISLTSNYATHRLIAGCILTELFSFLHSVSDVSSYIPIVQLVSPSLLSIAKQEPQLPFFCESTPLLRTLRSQCGQLLNAFSTQAKLPSNKLKSLAILVVGEREAGPGAFTIDDAHNLIDKWYDQAFKSLSTVSRIESTLILSGHKQSVATHITHVEDDIIERQKSVISCAASAYMYSELIINKKLPQKLNPVIRGVMDSVKLLKSGCLQEYSSDQSASLINQLIKEERINIVDKVVKNLCGFLCVDPVEVPEWLPNKNVEGIMSLKKDIKHDDVEVDESVNEESNNNDHILDDREVRNAIVKRRGGKIALEKLVIKFGPLLFEKIPKLLDLMLVPLESLKKSECDDKEGQGIIDSFELIKYLFPQIDKSLISNLFSSIDLVLLGLKSDKSVWRFSAAKCFAAMVLTCPTDGFQILVKQLLPMLQNPLNIQDREGGIEAVYHVVQEMGAAILPYVVFLIVPVLGRMSDSVQDVRLLATTTFAQIIKLVPLEEGIPDPEDMPIDLLKERAQERDFLQQMMDPSKIKPFELPVTVNATLRKYQQDGVNWLHFLNKYHLHGILCDDMGLGKTLQTICIVSSDHHLRAEKFSKTGTPESRRLSSLIVCPPSLTGHWEQEINQYAPFMKVLVYAGPPSIRSSLRKHLEKRDEEGIDVIVTSYDVLRNDSNYLIEYDYNYCVLDEGHIIKNSNTRLTKVVKQVKAEHRLVLSGTPIQNNVLELWSLFDFLMPGFLGSEKQFQEKFARPIQQSRTNKGKKEQEKGALALESLHKQVLPFMMRRLKEDVLSDLPPKIIQDYYCELSQLQKQLYKDFVKKQKKTITKDIEDTSSVQNGEAKQHVFQVLQYMRKLCNHPSLVLTPGHPQYEEVTNYLKGYNKDLHSIEHAPKLLALRNLLKECGIGLAGENIISQHRALIFCQMKDMLDIVENELLKKEMPTVTYLRMDGSTDPRYRQDLVRKFNSDPSIDLLLLTTKVGGLGLNLTGADTVIFVEHDWNPMNDLQAMDRAHRLGQKRVVNVYRLITRDTLEEKIMGLQKFKMGVAGSIVNQQNAGLASMSTGQLLDLFDSDDSNIEIEKSKKMDIDEYGVDAASGVDSGVGGQAAGAVKELGELWDEKQYEEEYNMDEFIKTLK